MPPPDTGQVTPLPPRFGVWTIVYGTWASRHHPADPPDASWERNRRLIQQAEALGFASTLIAQHIMNPRGNQHDQLETWTTSAALAAVTSRIELIDAIKPYLFHPVVLAKMALQIEEISRGRLAINLVNAWYKPEFERAGIRFAHHDERYAYGREWIQVVRQLFTGKPVTFHGHYFQIEDYVLAPASRFRDRPVIYLGGESEAARALAADAADVYFINGQPIDDVAALIQDVRQRRRTGAPVRFALSAFVIARKTDEEAREALAVALELARLDAAGIAEVVNNADPDAVMFKTFARHPHVIGTNGGTSAGLVGSYETVAARIRAFNEIGIETFMLQFQPFEAEMQRFAHEVIARVSRDVILPVSPETIPRLSPAGALP